MRQQNIPVLIALGGNWPFRSLQSVDVLRSALDQLAAMGLGPVRASRFFATPCFPPGAGPDYVNAAAALQTDLPAAEVLQVLHGVEENFSRTRTRRWGGRTLDLDLIAIGDQVLPDRAQWQHWHDLPADRQVEEAPQTLILPHPRLQDRAFVLVPLMDVAPDWRHPVLGRTVAEMTADLPQSAVAEVRPLLA